MTESDFIKWIVPDSILKRNQKDLLFNQIDGEYVMLSLNKNEYFGINKLGSRIWDLLEFPVQFKNLIHLLLNEFEVDEEVCIKDTKLFLFDIYNKDLIEINAPKNVAY